MSSPQINLLIVGQTGGGKSALANVLSNTDFFKESDKSVREETTNFQKETFKEKGKVYNVIDITVNSRLIEMKILYKIIAQGIYSMPEGISQVLFVVSESFTAEEIQT